MKLATIDQLAALPEEEAVQRNFDAHNYRVLRWVIVAASLIGFVVILASFVGHGAVPRSRQILALVHAAFIAFCIAVRQREWFAAHFRPFFIAFAMIEFALAVGLFPHAIPGSVLILFPPFFLLARLRVREYATLTAFFVVVCVTAGIALRLPWRQVVTRDLLAPAVVNSAYMVGGIVLMRSDRRRFLSDWSAVASGEQDRRRMRSELADARKIQLSMLPLDAPPLDWVDIASSSVPATEVGGDFFDYYKLSDDKLALVVGDVAGHGVPSGLVLAGMKSGLFLLRDRLVAPAAAMRELNDMVRDSIRWRMLVSLLVATIDRAEGRLHVVTAGHPPLLLWSASTQRVQRIGRGALPLGTRLHGDYTGESCALGAGDVLLLVTDGVTELASRDGSIYGDERLEALFESCAGASAAEIRDRIVADLGTFRGAAAQDDDVTLLVACVR